MIPKHKLAVLIAGLKPKGHDTEEEPEHEEEGDDDYEQKLDECIDNLTDAIVQGRREAISAALHELHDCMVDEDKEQDDEGGY